MVLGSRSRAITAAASAIAAMALAAAVAGRGCQVDDDSPQGVVRAFADAARAGDRKAILGMLGPKTLARLKEHARHATDLVGGPRRFALLDLVSVGKPGDYAAIKNMQVHRRAEGTFVEIENADGKRSELAVVEVDGRWRVELPGY